MTSRLIIGESTGIYQYNMEVWLKTVESEEAVSALDMVVEQSVRVQVDIYRWEGQLLGPDFYDLTIYEDSRHIEVKSQHHHYAGQVFSNESIQELAGPKFFEEIGGARSCNSEKMKMAANG